jgi:hypothetical protein
MCIKPEFVFLYMVVLSPYIRGENIIVCFSLLINELNQLWSVGALTYDVQRKHNFFMYEII